MKRWLVFGWVLLGLVFVTPVASADGPQPRACFGGTLVLTPEETATNVALFGCNLEMQSGARVLRDLVSFGGNVVLGENARIGGDVAVFGGMLRVAGVIEGDVAVFGGNVTLEPTARLVGDFAISGGVLEQREGAVVQGRIAKSSGMSWTIPTFLPTSNGWDIFGMLISGFVQAMVYTLALIALGALILVFVPTQLNQVASVTQKSVAASMGVGCLSWLIVPPLIIIFAITCLGIPVALALGTVWVAAIVFGEIAISVIIGEKLLTALKVKNVMPIVAMIVGLVVLSLVTSLPLLGILIWLFVTSLAVGAVALTRFGTRAYPVTTPVVASSAPAPIDDASGNI